MARVNPCPCVQTVFPLKTAVFAYYSGKVALIKAGAGSHTAEKAQLETDRGIGPNRNKDKEGGRASKSINNDTRRNIARGFISLQGVPQ